MPLLTDQKQDFSGLKAIKMQSLGEKAEVRKTRRCRREIEACCSMASTIEVSKSSWRTKTNQRIQPKIIGLSRVI